MSKDIKCDWFGCKKKATVNITRADKNMCREHFELNEQRFGCSLSNEELRTNKHRGSEL